MSIFRRGGWARSRWRGRGGTAIATICARLRRRLQTQPSNLDWARFLGPVKWREYDPQQYYNFRAYLDFGGGQVTDLFTHWIDAVHMFMEQDDPTTATAAGGVYHLQGWPHGSGHDQRSVAVSAGMDGDVRGDAGSGHHGRGNRNVRDRRKIADHERAVRIYAGGARGEIGDREGGASAGDRPRGEFSGLHAEQKAAQWRCVYRAPVGTGVAFGESRVFAEEADSFRSGAGRDFAVIDLWKPLPTVAAR